MRLHKPKLPETKKGNLTVPLFFYLHQPQLMHIGHMYFMVLFSFSYAAPTNISILTALLPGLHCMLATSAIVPNEGDVSASDSIKLSGGPSI